jgi:LysW-gamma-L-lysine carboxypeptidase
MTNSSHISFSHATLLGLVEHYSPSGQEKPAVEWLVTRMQALGYSEAYVDQAGNAVGVMGHGPRQVILLGHIDTVPGEIPVRIEENVLFGRGAVDAKGSLAAFTDAVARTGSVDGWQFLVIGAVGEEADSDGARFVTSQYHPDFTIIGEPSGWERITLGYKGTAWAKITLRRERSHTSRQEQSACEAAFSIWQAIGEFATSLNAGRERIFDQVSPTLRGLESGEDGFSEWASLRVGVRLPLDLAPQVWYEKLQETLKVSETFRVFVEPNGFSIPAHQCEKNTPLVRAFLACIREANGKPGFLLKTGTADLNIVAPTWGCPAVVYGPGDSALDHTPNEHLPLDEYERAVNVLVGVVHKISDSPNQRVSESLIR